MYNYQRILVIRGGAIGDFILTLPVFSVLKKSFSHAPLSLLGYPKTGQLALNEGLITEVKPIESPSLAAFFSESGRLDPAWKQYFEQFDLIVSFIYDPDRTFLKNLQKTTRATILIGKHRPDETEPILASEVFLRALSPLQISWTKSDTIPRLRFDGIPPQQLSQGKWIALHPGSGSERKNWHEQCWHDLLLTLCNETDWNFLLIGGEAEGERLQRLSDFMPEKRKYLAFNQSLVDVAILLQHSRSYLGHDSGITHLAAALDLPGLVLWGTIQSEYMATSQ